MSLPFFSCITITAGRQKLLEEAIAAFVRQDYDGDSELVILNTLPQQQLILGNGYENVRIINLDKRPTSLGAARNLAVSMAEGDWCVTWDDDDQYLPNHLSNFAEHAEGNDWLWQARQFYMLGWKIKAIVPGSANVLTFTRKAFNSTGGYKAMNCGEDRDMVGRITSQCKGKRIELTNEQVSFLYAWGNGAYHQSGQGDDRPGHATSWQRAEQDLALNIRRGKIATGEVRLEPKLLHDYVDMARRFTAQPLPPIRAKKDTIDEASVGVVMLGRYGDIINFLPVLRHIAESYGKPHLVISREFVQLLDGISYVVPYPVDLANDQLLPAIEIAKHHFEHVIVPQIWGKAWKQERLTEAYNKESWRQAGFLHKFSDPTWFPVFDRRNPAREHALAAKLEEPSKPMVLVKLDGSISSPCPKCPALLPLIQARFSEEFNIINLSSVQSERIYDLLGLFRRAAALVSIDTSMLHLAAASAVPYVALVNPQAWLGTSPRGNCVRRMTYLDALNNPETLISAILEATTCDRKEMADVEMRQPPVRRIFHCCERHADASLNEQHRKTAAWASWDILYAAGVMPAHYWEYKRTAKSIGDPRALPYLKDVLTFALDQMGDDDILIWSNDDVYLHPELPGYLRYHVSVYGACTSQRVDYGGKLVPVNAPVEEYARRGRRHLGRDLLAATKKWFLQNWEQIGDPILGASDFDLHLAAMVRLGYGVHTTRPNVEEHIFPAEIPLGYVAHQRHASAWAQPKNINLAPSQRHNRMNFRRWAAKYLPTLKFNANNEI